jgi:hypothetical protein
MKLVIITKTDEEIDYNRTNIVKQIEDILDDDDNCKIVEFGSDESSMHQVIYDRLNDQNKGFTAYNIWEDIDNIFVGYFVDAFEYNDNLIENQSDKKPDDLIDNMTQVDNKILEILKDRINKFGSQLTSHNVVGDLVIVKMKLEYEIKDRNISCRMVPQNTSIYEINQMIRKIFIKEGLSVGDNGEITTYKYVMNPLEPMMLNDPKYEEHLRYHEYEFYNVVLKVIVDLRDEDKPINESMSWLCGKVVKGMVRIGMYKKPEFNEQPPYHTITADLFKKIVMLKQINQNIGVGVNRSPNEYMNLYKIVELDIVQYQGLPKRKFSELDQVSLNTIV